MKDGASISAMTFGRDEADWDILAAAGEEFLIERARLGRLTAYTELNAALERRTGLRRFDFELQAERAAMGHLLGLIVRERNRPATGLMISSLVEVNQVHARTNNYQDLFEKDGSLIRLREESPMLTGHPQTIAVFRDDDRGFFGWLDDHPDGYFINSERRPKPTYLVLHRPSCPHFDRGPVHWTRDYIKICSPDRGDLEEWATGTVGGDVTLCRACFG